MNDRINVSIVRELAEVVVNKTDWTHESLMLLKRVAQAELRHALNQADQSEDQKDG